MEARATRIAMELNGFANQTFDKSKRVKDMPATRVRIQRGTEAWRSANLLRLEEADPGHVVWTRARDRGLNQLARLAQAWSREDPDGRSAEELVSLPVIGPFGGI